MFVLVERLDDGGTKLRRDRVIVAHAGTVNNAT
jgi:hypothetical protein